MLENHDFRGYMGCIESGIVNVGDRVTVLPSSRSSILKQILTFDGELNRAFSFQSVIFLLEDNIDIFCGDMIVKSGDTVRVMKEYEVDICWLGEQSLDLKQQYI